MSNKIEKKDGIEKLKTNITLPSSLEDKIIMKLKSMNLISSGEKKRSMFIFKITYSFSLLLIGLFIGYSINGNDNSKMAVENSKSKYILLLYQDENLKGEESERVRDYSLWANEYGAKRIVVTGERLEETGKILSMSGENVSVAEIKSTYERRVTSGYFIIETNNYDEAVDVALTCPHIKYGGNIEIREITDFSKL